LRRQILPGLYRALTIEDEGPENPREVFAMRITGPNGPAVPAAAGGARRTTSGSFSLPQEEAAKAPAGTGAVRTVAGIEALMALQGVESAEERRRRAVKRGHTALDLLDEMKLGLLSGRLASEMVHKLRSAAAGLKDLSGDPRIDQVLAEIDLRVEVELAKVESAAA
jgi:Class II flagellar assembly regulator